MPERRRKYTPEFKDEAARMVVETSRPIAEVAREIHVNEGTLGNWVAKYRVDHAGEEPHYRSRSGHVSGNWKKRTVN
jgi:transposase